MCGRFVLKTPVEALARIFGFPERPNFPARYNIAPTDPCPVVRAGPSLAVLRWGLVPFYARDIREGARCINARAEAVAGNRAFARAFRERRCLVPADGFYEWKTEGKLKQPFFFAAPDGAPIAFAGIWDRWRPKEGEPVESFSIITTEANAAMAPVHDRMPVVLPRAAWALWLDPTAGLAELQTLLQPPPDDALVSRKVDRRVGKVGEEGPELIAAVA
jgi:putative SOS response-associated peptidase YedK